MKVAVDDWLLELHKVRQPPKSVAVATAPIPQTPTGPVSNINTTPVPAYNDLETTNIPTTNVNPVEILPASSSVLVNSLVDPLCSPENSPPRDRLDSDTDSDISLSDEPMDCVPSAITDSLKVLESDTEVTKDFTHDNVMQIENPPCDSEVKDICKDAISITDDTTTLSYEDVNLLISFFYLPFEYAAKPVQMLQDLHWLQTNCHLVGSSSKQVPPQVSSCYAVAKYKACPVLYSKSMLKFWLPHP